MEYFDKVGNDHMCQRGKMTDCLAEIQYFACGVLYEPSLICRVTEMLGRIYITVVTV